MTAATKPSNAFTLVPGQGSQITARNASFRSSATASYVRRALEDRHGGEYSRAVCGGISSNLSKKTTEISQKTSRNSCADFGSIGA